VLGKFAMIPVLEPSSQQEAYNMVHYGFDMSEKLGVPVLMRITTRLAHSRTGVIRRLVRAQNKLQMPADPRQFILLPANARQRYKELLKKQATFESYAFDSGFNILTDGTNKSLGIITSGIAYNYLLENYPDRHIPFPVLKISQYPVPKALVEHIYNSCEKLLILEEGYPVLEESIKGLLNTGKTIHGRLDGTVPRDGELNPNIVAVALGMKDTRGSEIPSIVVARPPSLCKGCPHIYSFNALNEAINKWNKGRVFSDIGCYSLGALAPFDAINTCVDMGASITMAKGAADAGLMPVVAVIGDSTFAHSGITGLLDCVKDNSQVTIMILDNETTAMTGGQDSSALGRIENICIGVGVAKDHIFVLNPSPKYHEKNVSILRQELDYKGVSVIIPRRECIQTAIRNAKEHKKKLITHHHDN
jgi:indolepyruvate ferredoxin oxidoreductase alpha subunit